MLANLSKKWTEPKISTSGKEWSVWFRFYNSDIRKWILIRRKGGANYSRLSKRERLAELYTLKQAITYKLEKLDWNPITNTCANDTGLSVDQQINDLDNMAFVEAIAFAKEKSNWNGQKNLTKIIVLL